MATAVNVTTTPTAIPGLTANTRYVIQNQGNEAILVSEGATASPPNANSPGIEVPPHSLKLDDQRLTLHTIRPRNNESVFVWTRQGTTRAVVADYNS